MPKFSGSHYLREAIQNYRVTAYCGLRIVLCRAHPWILTSKKQPPTSCWGRCTVLDTWLIRCGCSSELPTGQNTAENIRFLYWRTLWDMQQYEGDIQESTMWRWLWSLVYEYIWKECWVSFFLFAVYPWMCRYFLQGYLYTEENLNTRWFSVLQL